METEDRLLRRKDVEKIVGVSRSWIYSRMLEGGFPRPVRIGRQSVRWRESEVRGWIAERAEGSQR